MTLTFFLFPLCWKPFTTALWSVTETRAKQSKTIFAFFLPDNVNIIRDFSLWTLLMMKSRKKTYLDLSVSINGKKGIQFSKLMQRYDGRNCTPKRNPASSRGSWQKLFYMFASTFVDTLHEFFFRNSLWHFCQSFAAPRRLPKGFIVVGSRISQANLIRSEYLRSDEVASCPL